MIKLTSLCVFSDQGQLSAAEFLDFTLETRLEFYLAEEDQIYSDWEDKLYQDRTEIQLVASKAPLLICCTYADSKKIKSFDLTAPFA